jgi:hypothetical protein
VRRLAHATGVLGLNAADAEAALALRGWMDGGRAVHALVRAWVATLAGATAAERALEANRLVALLPDRLESDTPSTIRARRLAHATGVLGLNAADAEAALVLRGWIDGGHNGIGAAAAGVVHAETAAFLRTWISTLPGNNEEDRLFLAHTNAWNLLRAIPRTPGATDAQQRMMQNQDRLRYAIETLNMDIVDALGTLAVSFGLK